MSRLIDADLIQYEPMLSPKGNGQYEEVSVAYKSQIDDLPTIEERKRGMWLWLDGVRCSNCNHKLQTTGLTSFCPNCGARMEM